MLDILTPRQKMIVVGILGFAIGFSLAFFWMRSEGLTKTVRDDDGTSPTEAGLTISDESLTAELMAVSGANTVMVDDQKPGLTVAIRQVSLAKPAWVAIHEDRAGKPGNILGAVLFDTGTHEGSVNLLRNTVVDGIYYAMLHSDNGDTKFDYKVDKPITDPAGNPIMVRFTTDD